MGSGLVDIKADDWFGVRRNFQKIGKNFLGPRAEPEFAGVTLSGLTDNALVYPVSGALTSLAVATNGKVPIGSTGAAPVLATITGTAKRVTVTNAAGSITLSLPQDYDTGATPILAGLTITNAITEFSIDGTLGGNSDSALPTEKAVKTYVDLSIGAAKDYFLSDNDDVGIANYHILHQTDTGEAASDEETAAMDEGDDQLMFSFITASGVPGVTFLRSGVYVLHTHLARTTGNRPTTFYWTLSKYALNADETVLMTSETSSAIPGSMASFITHAVLSSDATILTTDRLVLKLHANVTGGGQNSIITIYMEGTNDCHITNLLPSNIWQTQDDGLDSLAGLTYAAASFIKMTGANTFALRTIGETADDLEGTIDHDQLANGGAHDYAYISGNDGATGVTAAELEELSDGSETTLHSHAAGGAHTHDGDTLQFDGLNSDGGAFPITTSGVITINAGTNQVRMNPTVNSGTDAVLKTGNVTTTLGWCALRAGGANINLSQIQALNTGASSSTAGGGFIVSSDDGAAMASGHRLGYFLFNGSQSAAATANGGGIVGYADGNWTAGTSYPTKFAFEVCASGATTRTERLTIKATGYIGISETAPVTLLEMTGANPTLTLHNSNHEDGDNTRKCKLSFRGEQTGGEETILGVIEASHHGVGDDQKGSILWRTNDGTDGTSPSFRMLLDSSGFLGLGTSTPYNKLHVKSTASGYGITLQSNSVAADSYIGLKFLMSTSDSTAPVSWIRCYRRTGVSDIDMHFAVGGNDRLVLDDDGSVTLGTVVTGTWAATDVAIAHGGSGQSTAQAAIDALTQVSGATNEHVLTKDTGTGQATWKAAVGADAFTVKIDAAAIAGYIGAANNDGVLRTGTGLSYTDGGNFVTLNIADIGAAVYNDAVQNAANADWTELAFNQERWDTDTIHDNSTNNTRLTCKTAGKYVITGCFTFPANAVGERGARVYLNGTTTIAMSQSLASAADSRMNITTIYNLGVNDYVELGGYQDSGGILVIPVTGNYSPEFRMQRIA